MHDKYKALSKSISKHYNNIFKRKQIPDVTAEVSCFSDPNSAHILEDFSSTISTFSEQNSTKYNKDNLLFNFSDQHKQMTTGFLKNVIRILTEK